MKVELGQQIMKEFVELQEKTYSYLKDNNDEDKKSKRQKKCIIIRELKSQEYKNCLKAAQIDRKINCLRKKEIDVDSLKKRPKNKLILRTPTKT